MGSSPKTNRSKWALKRITREDFGEEHAKWKRWYEGSKEAVKASAGGSGAKRKTSEKRLATFEPFSWAPKSAVVSSDNRHIAYFERTGAKWRVVVDGRKGEAYDDLGMNSLKFSQDGKRMAHMCQFSDIRGCLFEPDLADSF